MLFRSLSLGYSPCGHQAYPGALTAAFYGDNILGVCQNAEEFLPLNTQSVLYPAIYLQPRCPSRHFGRNLLTPVLISLSPLAPGHPNDLHISTGNGPPSRFRETSSCPGLDRLVSGPTAMTPGTFTPRPSYTRRCIADLLLSLWLQA